MSIFLGIVGVAAGLCFTLGGFRDFLQPHSVGIALCAATGIVFLLPLLYLWKKRRFDFFHPLVYPVVTYLFVAFFLGGLSIVSGLSYPWILDLVPEPGYYISLSFIHVIVGFLGLMIGFSLPIGKSAGRVLSGWIPDWNWSPKDVLLPGLVLLIAGMAFDFLAIAVGVGGYQVRETAGAEGGVVQSFTIIGSLGSFLLWWGYFKLKEKSIRMKLLVLALVSQIALRVITSGSRAALLVAIIGIFAAYRFSGRRIRSRTLAFFAVMAVIAVFVGFSVGTAYRDLKGSEYSSISPKESVRFGIEAVKQIGQQDIAEVMADSLGIILRRFEAVSSLSVVVANYKDLEQLESQYGIKSSIWTASWTSLIPRFLWPEKPTISNARSFSDLYFNVATTSYGITVFGDLVRSFGPLGVPVGMAFLGILLRLLYTSLLEIKHKSIFCTACYFLLLSRISYESFFGNILPGLIRLSFALLLAGMAIQLLLSNKRRHGSGFPL